MEASRESVTTVKEFLNKNPIDTTNNTVSFLNGLIEDDLKAAGIRYRISVITWARKVFGKHQHLALIQENIDIMHHQVKLFIDLFTPLFKKGIPLF